MRHPVAVLVLVLALPSAVHGQQGEPVFVSGPIQWSPSVSLVAFGYDSNIFLAPEGRALPDITGTLSPAVSMLVTNPRFELSSSAAIDLVYFERYVEQRAFNQKYAGRAAVTVSLFQPFVAGEWQRLRDRQSPEVDLRARRVNRTTTAGLGLFSLGRTAVTLSVSRSDLAYEAGQTFQSVDLATQLNRTSDVATAGLNIAVTPLTSLTVAATLQRDSYPLSFNKDQQSSRATVGVLFQPDAVIRGHATVGYSRLTVDSDEAIPFQGFTTDVDIRYSILSVTDLLVRYSRETAASIREPYYLQTLYGVEVQQAFLGPFDLLARASRQELNYPGLPARALAGHLDYLQSYAAGFLVRLSETSSLDTTYEISHRESTDVNLRYERRRLITSVSLGF